MTSSSKIQVAARFARSANIERDATRTEPFDGYVVTARALDVLERIATTATSTPAGGAWSITGPYGSGKSSLALLIDAALGPAGPARQRATELVAETSGSTADLLASIHQHHQTLQDGFIRGPVTAGREPVTHTVLRALRVATERRYGRLPSQRQFRSAAVLRGALEDAASDDPRRQGPSPSALVDIAINLAEDAPLLLVVDEFGKNLEAVRDSSDSDPYLLQQLAEAGQGSSGLPIFLVTLQHLAFEDYFAGDDSPEQREWAKVQGRFEDIPYVESPEQTRSLIATVFNITDQTLHLRVQAWADQQLTLAQDLGLTQLADPDLLASCYPLDAVALAVLPELCSRYGQNERTLFSFLTGADRASARSAIDTWDFNSDEELPTVGLPQIYDYFVTGGTITSGTGAGSSRWTEIATRLRDAHGLDEASHKILKSVAVLNLISTTGTLRSSPELLARTDPDARTTIRSLVETGFLTYREFSDEYRIWQGTDLDIKRLVDQALVANRRRPLADLLNEVQPPRPEVAARHSAEHDTLRVFARRYVDGEQAIAPLDAFDPHDGLVLLNVGGNDTTAPERAPLEGSKPVIIATPESVTQLEAIARELASLRQVLDDDAVKDDQVARRELSERLAQIQVDLEAELIATFGPLVECTWTLLTADGPVDLPGGRGSAPLSQAADIVYPATPPIRNEMLNRYDPTSQGARARRELLQAMLTLGEQADLGFEGYGPEVAMYRTVLRQTGIHHFNAASETYVFRAPTNPQLAPAWTAIEEEFNRSKARRINLRDIYGRLLSPPFGMKAGAIPVLVTAALIARSHDIAIYEHGTFKPLLAPELSERMVRNPGHFELKHFSSTAGGRADLVAAAAKRLGVAPAYRKHRVANVLAIVGALVTPLARLDRFTKITSRLSDSARSLRDTLLQAVEPDELLFTAIPDALGLPPAPPDMSDYPAAESYAELLGDALDEIRSRYDRLLEELADLVLEVCGERTWSAVTGQATALADEVLDPAIRAFVLTLGNSAVDNKHDWVEAIATVVSQKAPREWDDRDLSRFGYELNEQVAAFHRLLALHAERRADGGGAFNALRLTVTRADGFEHARLVSIDEDHRDLVNHQIAQMIDELGNELGSKTRARQAALARLSELMLDAAAPTSHTVDSAADIDETRHA